MTSLEANRYFELLSNNILWENDKVIIFGKSIVTRERLHGMVTLIIYIRIQIPQSKH